MLGRLPARERAQGSSLRQDVPGDLVRVGPGEPHAVEGDVGAFGQPANANALWARASARAELAGKRRIDVHLRKIRTETPAQAGLPQARGDVLVCEIYSKRIAGQFFDTEDEAEAKREQPMVMWLAHLDDSPFVYAAKLEAKTGFGTIRGKLLNFQVRPMTPEEKAAMQR